MGIMVSNDDLKEGIILYLKSKTSITARVSSDEIKEVDWQGTEFTFPCIRVQITRNASMSDCNGSEFSALIHVLSEQYSSLESDEIAGIINNELHSKSFSSNNLAFAGIQCVNLIPAIRMNRQTWRSAASIVGKVS